MTFIEVTIIIIFAVYALTTLIELFTGGFFQNHFLLDKSNRSTSSSSWDYTSTLAYDLGITSFQIRLAIPFWPIIAGFRIFMNLRAAHDAQKTALILKTIQIQKQPGGEWLVFTEQQTSKNNTITVSDLARTKREMKFSPLFQRGEGSYVLHEDAIIDETVINMLKSGEILTQEGHKIYPEEE